MKQSFWRLNWVQRIILVSFGLPFIILAMFSHPQGDDYCIASLVKDVGLYNAQLTNYFNYNGRYTAFAIVSFISSFKNFWLYYRLAVFLLFVGLWFSLYGLMYTLLRKTSSHSDIVWSTFFLFDTYLACCPTLLEGFYWLSGAACYQLGAILIFSLIAMILSAQSDQINGYKLARLPVLILVTVLAAGTSEPSLLVLLCVGTLMIFLNFWISVGSRLETIVVFVTIALCSFVVVYSPGNLVRTSLLQNAQIFGFAFFLGPTHGFYFIVKNLLQNSALMLGGVMMLPGLLSICGSSTYRFNITTLTLFWPSFASMILIIAIFFTCYYALGHPPPLRVENLCFWILFVGWLSTLVSGVILIKKYLSFEITIPKQVYRIVPWFFMLSIVTSSNFSSIFLDVFLYAPRFHASQEQRYEVIRRAAWQESVDISELPKLSVLPLNLTHGDLSNNPSNYVNACMAHYFGAKGIAVDCHGEREGRGGVTTLLKYIRVLKFW